MTTVAIESPVERAVHVLTDILTPDVSSLCQESVIGPH